MSNRIPICYINDQLLENIRENSIAVGNLVKDHSDTNWLKKYASGQMFEEKKFYIPDFDLKLSDTGDYSEVDFINSVILSFVNICFVKRYNHRDAKL